MQKKVKQIVTAIMIMCLVVLSACGNGDSGKEESKNADNGNQNLGQKELKIPYVAWASAIASNHVIEVVLEQAGYEVELLQVNSGAMYSGVADGSADATISVWLPHTDAAYWEQYKENLVHLGPNLKGAPLGLVVPKYMKIDSIKDLAKNKYSIGDKTEWTITGIEPGAGQMKLTEEKVMPAYGLDKWTLQASSSGAMAASLGDAIANKEPIVVTLWSPHWAFSKWDLKYLKDPKNIYGDPDNINTLVREGLKKDAPKAYKILDQFSWTKKDIGEVMVKINKGMKPVDAAKEWVKNNQDLVSEWTKGIK
ncbi:glycine betaine ABC transporter substrate-binding protein [Virgibacillus ihumii]|uniref:glycine betaine ABC transporter substrate-binding protein n=1 Tax=Virgibacillus ihumii TaxID=2686091 RepID=UPI00157C4934|nr:glycine betaine ABC transporter substrate-binding protein [Virgibacillus ihumii]